MARSNGGFDQRLSLRTRQEMDLHRGRSLDLRPDPLETLARLRRAALDPDQLNRMRRALADEHPELSLSQTSDRAVLDQVVHDLASGALSLSDQRATIPSGGLGADPVQAAAPAVPDLDLPPLQPQKKKASGKKVRSKAKARKTKKKKELKAYLSVQVLDKNGAAVKGADVAVDGSNVGVTDASGLVKVGKVSPGTYEISAIKGGYETVDIFQQVDPGTSTLATVKLGAWQLTKVEPTEGTLNKPAKWIVNFSSSAAKKYGRYVTIKAHVSPKKAGATVRFKVEPGRANFDQTKFDSPSNDKEELTSTSADTDASGVAKTKLRLSVAGDDLFRVVAWIDGKDKDTRKSGWMQVRRKLYYQKTVMGTKYNFPLKQLVDEYGFQTLELEKYGAKVTGAYKENLRTSELKGYGKKYFKTSKSPMKAHIVLIDHQWDRRYEQLDDLQDTMTQTFKTSSEVWPFLDADDVSTDASWCKMGESVWHSSDVDVVRSGKYLLAVDLSGTTLTEADLPVRVRVNYWVVEGRYAGDGGSPPHCFIACASGSNVKDKVSTAVHEVGHLVGLVQAGHKFRYDNDNGGSGHHCRDGATPNRKSKLMGGTFAGEYKTGTCTMFGGWSDNVQFCPECGDAIMKTKFEAVDMRYFGWDKNQ